jgi:hypothetical protein
MYTSEITGLCNTVVSDLELFVAGDIDVIRGIHHMRMSLLTSSDELAYTQLSVAL